jgi:hypothetical protein
MSTLGRRIGWFLSREATLVILAGMTLAVLLNWSSFRHPRSTLIGGLGDPLLQAWQLAWGHHLVTEGGTFWTGNVLYPAVDGLAFSDALLGYLPFGLFGDGMYAAVMRYNIVYLFAFALAFAGCYALARQLGASWPGAALAGVVFAGAPWRLAHAAHLNILSTGGIALALFALARGHGYSFREGLRTDRVRPLWALAGWLIAAWQVTLGFAVGVPFVYLTGLIALVVVAVTVLRRREPGRRMVIVNGVGIGVFLAVTYLMTIPYRRVVDTYHFTRTWNEVVELSPVPRGFVTASNDTWLWQGTALNRTEALPGPWPGEGMILPGFVVILFAVAGLVVSAWPVRVRIGLAVAAVISAVLALGAGFFGGRYTYFPLWQYLPGWDALRTPGRLILWTTLFLALLAAGAVTGLGQALRERVTQPRRRRLLAAVLVLPALGAVLEAVPDRGVATVPGVPPGLRQVYAQTREPILILPMDEPSDFRYMLWSTEGFPKIANGHNGFIPPTYFTLAKAATAFPDPTSLGVLRGNGIREVVVLKSSIAGTPYADVLRRPVGDLPLSTSENADVVIFTLR